MKKNFIAHVKQNTDGNWAEPQYLCDHLNGTADKASKFAYEFGNKDWGELAGFWHDLGKFIPAWQKYLCRKSGFDPEAHIEESNNRPNHSTSGAVLAIQKFEKNYKDAARILSYVIGGHHSGLPDWEPQLHSRIMDENHYLIKDDLEKVKQVDEAKQFLDKSIPSSIPA
ncbi:MAG: CRISPR-associated endonuclease Cas3'', partial [Bacteroidetes bacterium]|nr:CRISPR-associated endonuclease Cas3'' [Bacteroidota bacterium]